MQPTLRHRIVNFVHSTLLLGGIAVIGWISISAIAGTFVSLMVVAGLILGSLLSGPAARTALLSFYRARPLTEREFPEGIAMLRELARRASLPAEPRLYYIPSAVPNAFAIGGPSGGRVCISDGLLRLLDRRELAGVLAHEVSHIANRDLWIMAIADVMTRATSMISYAGQFILVVNLPLLLVGAVTVPWIVPLLLIFSPTIISLLQLALSRAREFDADLGAAQLTGDPMGLASALVKLDRQRGQFWEEILLPGRRMPDPSLLRTHPPTEQRIAQLREIAASSAVRRPVVAAGADPVRTLIEPVTCSPRMHITGSWL
ncbi:MAG: zinc metalloprotease HtpX [Paracoccaceae bacterium]